MDLLQKDTATLNHGSARRLGHVMNQSFLLLAAALVTVAGCAATSPGGDHEPGSGPTAERADAARVAFQVTGMKKTRSGAT